MVHLGIGCESVHAGSDDLFVQNISDNIYTDDRVSLLCVSVCVCVLSSDSSVQNISDNIRTDMVSLWCESLYARSCDIFVQNICDNVRTDRVSLWCESVCVWSGYSGSH